MTRSLKPKKVVLLAALVVILSFFLVYFTRTPENTRDWSPDQAVLPSATFNGESVTIKNIRNFRYTSATDYTPGYYDKTFNLDDLSSLDYIVEPFGGIGSAHTFLSFGFEDGSYVAISVEIRKEIGESFSPILGFLRQYELMYVIADERDVIALRANFRQHDVYLYPVKIDAEKRRALFLDMLARANKLKDEPEFYNTLTNNCTTNIARHVNKIAPGKIPWDLRLLLPKNSDALAYELGLLDTSLPLADLREKSLITPLDTVRHRVSNSWEKPDSTLGQKHFDSLEFSRLIRER